MLKQCAIDAQGLVAWREMTQNVEDRRLVIQTLALKGFSIVSGTDQVSDVQQSCCAAGAIDIKSAHVSSITVLKDGAEWRVVHDPPMVSVTQPLVEPPASDLNSQTDHSQFENYMQIQEPQAEDDVVVLTNFKHVNSPQQYSWYLQEDAVNITFNSGSLVQTVQFEKPIKAQSSYRSMAQRMLGHLRTCKIGLMAIQQALISHQAWTNTIIKFSLAECTLQITGQHQLHVTTCLCLSDPGGVEPFRIKIEPPIASLGASLTIWFNQMIATKLESKLFTFRGYLNAIAASFEQMFNALLASIQTCYEVSQVCLSKHHFSICEVGSGYDLHVLQKSQGPQLKIFQTVTWRNFKLGIQTDGVSVSVFDMAGKYGDISVGQQRQQGMLHDPRLPPPVLFADRVQDMLSQNHQKVADCFAVAKSSQVKNLLLKLASQDFLPKFSSLVSYLECIYLLELIDPSFTQRQNAVRGEQNLVVETHPPQDAESIFKFRFFPSRRGNIFKLEIDVQFNHQDSSYQFKKIIQVFNSYYHKFVLPDDFLQRPHSDRAFRAFFELLSSLQIWQSLRLHELMFVTLQLFAEKPQPDLYFTYVQSSHQNQAQLEELRDQIKLRFWIQLDKCGYEQSRDAMKLYCFVIGYEDIMTQKRKLVKFYQEVEESRPLNFRPYFRSRQVTLQNQQFLGDQLFKLLTDEQFVNWNCLVRILKLAGMELSQLARFDSI